MGCQISDRTGGNILKRHGLGTAPERKRNTTRADFIRWHKVVFRATDFFTSEFWICTGLTTIYVRFFLQSKTRRIVLSGITPFPNETWLKPVARNNSAPRSWWPARVTPDRPGPDFNLMRWANLV